MFYKIKKNIIVPGRAGTAGRDSGPSTARLSCRARPGTIKRAVLRAGPLSTAHLAIYSRHLRWPSGVRGPEAAGRRGRLDGLSASVCMCPCRVFFSSFSLLRLERTRADRAVAGLKTPRTGKTGRRCV
jgi:hypothetical protein